MIKIYYFGFLKDTLNLEKEKIECKWKNSQELIEYLRSRNDLWKETLSEKNIFRLVINQTIVYEVTPIKSGDEIAILPPVTGG